MKTSTALIGIIGYILALLGFLIKDIFILLIGMYFTISAQNEKIRYNNEQYFFNQ